MDISKYIHNGSGDDLYDKDIEQYFDLFDFFAEHSRRRNAFCEPYAGEYDLGYGRPSAGVDRRCGNGFKNNQCCK